MKQGGSGGGDQKYGLRLGEWLRSKNERSKLKLGTASNALTSTPSGVGVNTPSQVHGNTPNPSGQQSQSHGPNQSNNVRPPSPASNNIMQASAPPGATLPGSGASTAWSGLEQALRALRISKHIYPPLGLALDDLTSHLPKFEAAARNRQDYDDLAIELKGMAELIERQLDAMISEESKRAIVSLSETIRAELKSVEGRQSQSGTRRVLDSLEEDEDIIRRYRRVEQLFRQLQGEASLSTWCTTNKYYMNTQLEGLRPARLARYDSSLSMEIGRRTCTENTRTKILQDSMKWSEDPNSAKIYWMNGMAGTGKTTIVYSLATILEARKQLAASFFCTRISPECREAKQIVPTIAYQLARRSAPFRHALCEALEEDPDIGFGRISSQFELLLKRPLVKIKDELPDNFVVVIDALDECNDPGIVEDFLNLLFRSVADLPIRFYVTSRPEPTIRDRIMAASECSRSILYLHEIERSLVQADIELYLREELAFMSPPDPDIKKLASHAGNLFIYAATAVRYIRPTIKGADSWTRLSVLLAINAESKQKLSGINDLYTAILSAAVDDQLEHHENARILDALWTVVCACEPIRVSTLTALCGLDNLDSIRTALQPLRSVLHVSDHSELVTTLHASFPDYVLDQERSGRFHCDKVAHGQYLAKRCFEIMQRQLRFNIGDIKSSYIPDDEIPEIKETICANISEELSYGCRFWIDHLTQTKLKPADILVNLVHEFLSHRLLFWMEVLSLKKWLTIGLTGMTKLNTWLAFLSPEDPSLLDFASDASKFIAAYATSPASTYTSHIYLSALPLSHPSNYVRSCYLPRFQGLLKVSGTLMNKLTQISLTDWVTNDQFELAALLPGSDLIALCSDGRISVQNIYNGRHFVQPFETKTTGVRYIGGSRNSTQVVSGTMEELAVWNMHDGSFTARVYAPKGNYFTSFATSVDGTHIACGLFDGGIGILNLQDPTFKFRSLRGHTRRVQSIDFSPNGTRFVSRSKDDTIRIWDVFTGDTLLVLNDTQGSKIVQFLPDGTHIITAPGSSRGSIRVWDISNASYFEQHFRDKTVVSSVAVSPNAHETCIAIVLESRRHTAFEIRNIYTWKLIAGPFKGHDIIIQYIAFSDDGARVVSTEGGCSVRVWDAHGRATEGSSRAPVTRHLNAELGLITSLDQKKVAAIFNSSVNIWDSRAMAPVASIPLGPNLGQLLHLQFSLDSTCFFTVHVHGALCTWDIRTATLIDGPRSCSTNSDIRSAASSIDGTRVVTWSSRSDTIELWDTRSRGSIAYCKTEGWIYSPRIMFAQGAQKFITEVHYPRRIINVWDTDNGARVAGPFELGELFDFSPNGTHIVCRSLENPVVGDLQIMSADSGEILSAVSTPDNQYIASAKFTSDGLFLAYNTYTAYYLWDICNHTSRTVAIRPKWTSTAPSFACSQDGWCLASGKKDKPRLEAESDLRIWGFRIDNPLCAVLQPDGWALDSGSRKLFWIPTAIKDAFLKGSGLLIEYNGSGYDDDHTLCVDFNDIVFGDKWSRCYIGG